MVPRAWDPARLWRESRDPTGPLSCPSSHPANRFQRTGSIRPSRLRCGSLKGTQCPRRSSRSQPAAARGAAGSRLLDRSASEPSWGSGCRHPLRAPRRAPTGQLADFIPPPLPLISGVSAASFRGPLPSPRTPPGAPHPRRQPAAVRALGSVPQTTPRERVRGGVRPLPRLMGQQTETSLGLPLAVSLPAPARNGRAQNRGAEVPFLWGGPTSGVTARTGKATGYNEHDSNTLRVVCTPRAEHV